MCNRVSDLCSRFTRQLCDDNLLPLHLRQVCSLVCNSLDHPIDPIVARHCNCVYYHDWHRTKRPKRANDGGGLLPGVSHALSPLPPSSVAGSAPGSASGTPFSSPRNTLASNSGVIVALSDGSQSPGVPAPTATPPLVQAPGGAVGAVSSAGLPFDEEAKLVYGVILSLRNMVKRLSGRYVSLPSPPPTSFRDYQADLRLRLLWCPTH